MVRNMKEKEGCVYSIAANNAPVAGCTISHQVYQEYGYNIFYFSMAEGTNISTETYEYPKLVLVASGAMEVFTDEGEKWQVAEGESLSLPQGVPVGMRTAEGCVYTEVSFRKETVMNKVLKDGEVFRLQELLPYQDGKIINMDLVDEPKLKFVLMSFAEGTGLTEHAAPGEAMIFALDGQGIIGYEGKEHTIKAGENFKFAKNGRHYVKADANFKMALLLTLE